MKSYKLFLDCPFTIYFYRSLIYLCQKLKYEYYYLLYTIGRLVYAPVKINDSQCFQFRIKSHNTLIFLLFNIFFLTFLQNLNDHEMYGRPTKFTVELIAIEISHTTISSPKYLQLNENHTFAVPISSATCERSFSYTKITETYILRSIIITEQIY